MCIISKVSLQYWKTGCLDVTNVTHWMYYLVLLLAISMQLVASYSIWLPSLPVYPSLLRITFALLQKPFQGNFWKCQGPSKSRFGDFKKDCYCLEIPKWQHKRVRYYKRRNLVSYFLNNPAKTYLYGPNIFQSKAFFHLSSNPQISCLRAFKY